MSEFRPTAFESDETELTSDERERLRTLGSLHILHSVPEERFDRITRWARELFDVPYAYVNLVAERYQWTKSQAGDAYVDVLPRRESFCARAIRANNTFVVADLTADARFSESPLVKDDPYLRFYAGRPLRARNGHALGTLCILDDAPRFLSGHELTLLDDLGVLVERELESERADTVDPLTEAVNLRGFSLLGPSLLESCRLNRHPATLICFDLIDFGPRDDRIDPQAGDDALRQFAQRVRAASRRCDLFARLDDDAFALLAADTRPADIDPMLARIETASDRFQPEDTPGSRPAFRYGLSTIGPGETASLTELLEEAEADRVRRFGPRRQD